MFESNDWNFENVFDDVEETRTSFHSLCQNEENTSAVKRRKVICCGERSETLSSVSTDSTFPQTLQSDTIANIKANYSLSSKNKNNVSREALLLGIFQETTLKTSDFEEVEEDLSGMKRKTQCFQSQVDTMSNAFRNKESREKTCKFMTKVRLAKEVKLIRMFPGPAGLIPDQAKNSNTSAVPSYPSSINELEDKTTATKMNRHIKIKSQDEKNLFGEKAWKLLFNDLPNNFLQDYKISTIKNKANASRCDSTRVRFIAGVLDYVDHSHDDPFVVLKDSTDSIEGIIHRDIPLTYPGILEPNVVILLHDVGLLKTTTSDFSEQSSYVSGLQKMDKGRNAPSQISTSIDRSPSTKDHKSELAKNPLLPNCSTKDEKYGSCEKIFKNNDKNGKDEMCGRSNFFSYSMDTDDVDMDGFFTTDYDFTTLDEQNCSSSKSISQTNEVEWRDSQVQNTRHFENTKKESIRNVEEQIKKQHLRENNFSFYNDTAYRDLNLNKVKTTLIEHNAGNSKALISYFTNDKCDEYDSDDEILSQLNVDNIFDKLKNDC